MYIDIWEHFINLQNSYFKPILSPWRPRYFSFEIPLSSAVARPQRYWLMVLRLIMEAERLYTQLKTTENEDESLIACLMRAGDSSITGWLHIFPLQSLIGGSHRRARKSTIMNFHNSEQTTGQASAEWLCLPDPKENQEDHLGHSYFDTLLTPMMMEAVQHHLCCKSALSRCSFSHYVLSAHVLQCLRAMSCEIVCKAGWCFRIP